MKNIILFFGILAPFFAYSQSSWELGANVGAANYQGDIVESKIFTLKETNLGYGAFLRRNFNDHWGLRLNAQLGNVSGDDANYDTRKTRGYSFESPVTELSLRLEFNMLKREKADGSRRKIIPYVLAGAGYTLYDPTTEYSIATKNQDQVAKITSDKTNLEKNVISIPFGAGFKFPLSDKWTLNLEGTMNPTLGDYVDGVSASGDETNNDWLAFGTLGLAYRFGNAKDSDGDGISDRKDKCPDVAGVAENMGCPADRDKDGVYDNVDKCPDVAGVAANMGCPADRDGDGVYDKDDKCPDVKGIAANMGCPSDRDKDGVNDADDKCPDLAGIAANMGCPSDRDKDGVYDTDDKCPDVKGVAANAGCPSDRDKDGIYDTDDKCPDLAGIAANMGCPSDRDKDGVYDASDRCPDVPGLTTNGGCPELKAEDKKVLDLAVKNVNFESGKAVLTAGSYKILDQVADILNRYNYYSVAIEGHTDNQGDDAKNLSLSQNRAKACYDYLIKKGVATSRMSHNGYGETKPVATNDTAEGRRQNRRVEFNLSVK